MTETAKQGTTKAPAPTAETGPATTESAATQGAAEQETQAAPAPDADAQAAEPAKPDLDETKRKFREALERKNQAHSEGQGKGNRDGGKINGAHGPAASRRNFRRKSG
jgi:cytosine/adenosine deaminase-related metal-dependent hydrolase